MDLQILAVKKQLSIHHNSVVKGREIYQPEADFNVLLWYVGHRRNEEDNFP